MKRVQWFVVLGWGVAVASGCADYDPHVGPIEEPLVVDAEACSWAGRAIDGTCRGDAGTDAPAGSTGGGPYSIPGT